jgi:hydroxyethylthiazole kinase-like uncharacterized protein yjeF
MGWQRPLYDAESMRATDSWAIEERGLPSLQLMEAAGAALAEAVREAAQPGPVRIVCGKGNNGGDGLVAARLLAETGFEVEALLLWPGEQLSDDAKSNLEALGEGAANPVEPAGIAAALAGSGAVVDAIFGTGFDGEPRSPAKEAIEAVNDCGAVVIAADIASGIDADSGEAAEVSVEADLTVTFHAAKIGQRVNPGKRLTGELRVAEIGIPDGSPVEAPAGEIFDGALATAPRRGGSSTKFTSGQVLIAGGSRGLTGSVCLAAEATIRAGAGYATVAVPAELEPIFELKLTEVMSRGLPSAEGSFANGAAARAVEAAEGAACVLAGPGLGRAEPALAFARELAAGIEAPLVLDADGLNAHAGALGSLASRSKPTILTPHAGELGRLLERSSDEVARHRLACVRDAASVSGAIVVLKGDDTIVADGRSGSLAINVLSSPALATAGTGDVLGGMIGALLARGMEPFDAACAAVIAHARAGRIAAERVGSVESVIASDVIAAIPAGLEP